MRSISRPLCVAVMAVALSVAGESRGQSSDLQQTAADLATRNSWEQLLTSLDQASPAQVATYWFFYFRALAYYGKAMPVPASHDQALFETFLRGEERANNTVVKGAAPRMRQTLHEARERARARVQAATSVNEEVAGARASRP